MKDELIEQYKKEKTRFELFFEWLRNLSLIPRLIVIQLLIGVAFCVGYLISSFF